MTQQIQHNQIEANGVNFSYLECGSGPIALCVHGFPDSAHTWRFLMPELAQAGFRPSHHLPEAMRPRRLLPMTATKLAHVQLMSMNCMKRLVGMKTQF